MTTRSVKLFGDTITLRIQKSDPKGRSFVFTPLFISKNDRNCSGCAAHEIFATKAYYCTTRGAKISCNKADRMIYVIFTTSFSLEQL